MSKVLRFEPGAQTLHHPVTTIPLPKSLSVETAGVELTANDASVVLEPSPEQLLDEARREAEQILAEAREEAEKLRKSARDAGYEAGRAEAEVLLQNMQVSFEQDRAIWERTRQEEQCALESLAQAISRHREQVLSKAVEPLPQLCMEIVRELLRRELQLAPADIEAMVTQMLRFILESTRVEIRVSPADYPAATAAHPAWRNAKYGEWDLVIVPDPSIEAGGCEVRSDVGRLDGTLAVKLEMVQEALDAAFLGGDERGDAHRELTSLV